MYRKSNPWVSLVALLLLALILVLTCTGCTSRAETAEDEPAPRFTTEYAGRSCVIITDTQTGAQYLAYNGHGIAKLED